MTRYTKNSGGNYVINGNNFQMLFGSRAQVWHGTAYKTSGGLTKKDLVMSHGRVVSSKKHFSAKKENRLVKAGYGTKKGKFGYVKLGTMAHHRRGRKRGSRRSMSGGMYALSPESL